MAEENKNILEGAKFGDKFVTRDCRVAIYWRKNINQHVLITEDGCATYCDDAGNDVDDYDDDIVSRYQEEIDEVELDELAHEDLSTCGIVQTKEEQISYIFGFKAGYRERAKEER